MEKLKTKLEDFNPSSENDLLIEGQENPFYSLAEAFLYGGYVSVKDCNNIEWYRIYFRTIEFYCHSEDKNSDLPKDPIVYHRNGRYIDGEVPYFPLMSFHAHASGIDITFEKEELALRSSVLIRAYEVYDVHIRKFLTFNKKSEKFVVCENEKERVNNQSTYLYDFLNGFTSNSVEWIDSIREKTKDFTIKPRQNVFKYEGEEKSSEKDERKWSYTRMEDLNKNLLK